MSEAMPTVAPQEVMALPVDTYYGVQQVTIADKIRPLTDKVGDFINSVRGKFSPRKSAAVIATAGLAFVSCGGGNAEEGLEAGLAADTDESSTSSSSTSTTNGEVVVPFVVDAGDDATIGAETAAGLYQCGGPGDVFQDPTTFSPRHLVAHMNANPDLAEADFMFWTTQDGQNEGFGSEEAFALAVEEAISPVDTDDEVEVTADFEGAFDYQGFLNRQVIATPAAVPDGTVSENYRCVDTDGDGKGDKIELHSYRDLSNASLTGLLLHAEDYQDVVEAAEDAGHDLHEGVIVFDTEVDINGDGELSDEERDLKFLTSKHAVCGNNETPPEEQPPRDNPPTPTTHGTVPPQPTVPTPTTRPRGSTTSTTNPPSTTQPTVPTTPDTVVTTTAPRSSNTVVTNPVIEQPGTPGTADNDNEVENNTTTSEPAPRPTIANTTTTAASSVTNTTLGQCGAGCE